MITTSKHTANKENQAFDLNRKPVESKRAFASQQKICNNSPFDFNQIPLQAKLKINTPGDRYEQEADRIADKVVEMKEVGDIEKGGNSQIQKKTLSEEITNIGTLRTQRKCSQCEEEEEEIVQRKLSNTQPAASATSSFNTQLNATKGGGNSMDASTNHYMSSRFGLDFSHVKIHNNTKAAKMSKSINAKAFTIGNDIYFNKGEYIPGTTEGKRLLAHELVHTVQQDDKSKFLQRRVDRVEMSCENNQIIFIHDGQSTSYELTYCEGATGVYEANVIEGRNTIDFTLQEYDGGEFGFSYNIGPGQANPNTFFNNQSQVLFHIGTDETSEYANISSLSQFKQFVINAGIARMQSNRATLLEWIDFLSNQLTGQQFRRQMHAEQELDLLNTAFEEGGRAVGVYEQRAGTHNPAMRFVQQQQIEGRYRACTGCHATVQAENWGNEQRSLNLDVGQNWRTPVEQLETYAIAETLNPSPQPNFVGAGNAGRGVPSEQLDQLGRTPNTARMATAINRIQPYLQQLGPTGFRIINSTILSTLESSTSSSTILNSLTAAIEERRRDYAKFIVVLQDPDFDYMMLRPIVRELMVLVNPEVKLQVEEDIDNAETWDTIKNITIGAATIGSVLLAIFPPTSVIGTSGVIALETGLGAYSLYGGYQTYSIGRILSLGRGADNVLDRDQQDAANVMMVMGIVEMIGGGIGLSSAGIRGIRLIKPSGTIRYGGALRHAEAQVGDKTVRLNDLDSTNPSVVVTNPRGQILHEGPLDELLGTQRAANDNAYLPNIENNVMPLPRQQELPIAVGESRPLSGSQFHNQPSGPIASSRGGDPPDLFEIYTQPRMDPVPSNPQMRPTRQPPNRISDGTLGEIDDLPVTTQRRAGVSLAESHHIASKYNRDLISIFDEVGLSIEGRANRVLLEEHGQLRGFWRIVDDGGRIRYNMRGHHPDYHQWVFNNLQRARGTGLPLEQSQQRVLNALEQMQAILQREPYILEYGTSIYANSPDLIEVIF